MMARLFSSCAMIVIIATLNGCRSSSMIHEPMERTEVEGRPVAYHVVGRRGATPLLLINGGPGFDHRFHHLSPAWKQLATSRPVIFFDQPGTGESWHVGLGDPIAIADVLDSIDAVRRATGAEKVALLGHSWGGYLALAYALRHPERVERIVLANSIAPKVSATAFLFGALFPDIAVQRRGLRAENQADIDKYSRLTLAMSFYSPETRDRILSTLEGPVAYNRRLEILWSEAESRDLTEKLSEISVPVLILTGRFDANVAPRTAWSTHELIAGSQYVVFEKSGHFPMIEEPDRFARVADAFMRGAPLLTPRPLAARLGMAPRIVFDSNRDGSDEIYLMDPDGSNVRRLTNVGRKEISSRVPDWSPDGSRIVFQSNRAGRWGDLYVVDAAGGNLRQLTDTPGSSEGAPAWSPDGGSVAYVRSGIAADGTRADAQIWIIDASGANPRQVTSEGRNWYPAWSPDGATIAFASDRDGDVDVYLMGRDGANVRQLTNSDGANGGPAWSPDGSRIAFDSTRDGNYELYVIDTDGSNTRRLTYTPRRSEARPTWSPDGKQIAFNAGTEGDLETYEVCVVDVDGSNLHCLTDNGFFDAHADWK